MNNMRHQTGSLQRRGAKWLLKYRDAKGVQRTHTLEAKTKSEGKKEAQDGRKMAPFIK